MRRVRHASDRPGDRLLARDGMCTCSTLAQLLSFCFFCLSGWCVCAGNVVELCQTEAMRTYSSIRLLWLRLQPLPPSVPSFLGAPDSPFTPPLPPPPDPTPCSTPDVLAANHPVHSLPHEPPVPDRPAPPPLATSRSTWRSAPARCGPPPPTAAAAAAAAAAPTAPLFQTQLRITRLAHTRCPDEWSRR